MDKIRILANVKILIDGNKQSNLCTLLDLPKRVCAIWLTVKRQTSTLESMVQKIVPIFHV